MDWIRYTLAERKTSAIQFAAIILMLLSFYIDSKFLFFAGAVAFSAIHVGDLYGKKAGEGLEVTMKKRRERFFLNDKGSWELIFWNSGWPILNGETRIVFDKFVGLEDGPAASKKVMNELIIPFSIMKGETKRLEIPFIGKSRGLARIRKLELHIPNLIGFGKTILEYRNPLGQEALVYPQRLPVKNITEILSGNPGSQFSSSSLYEDMMSPAGTRDYMYSDGFKHIHWKASARTGYLQTRVFDRVTEKGFLICLNVLDGYSVIANFERMIAAAADLAYFGYSHCIPVSICINFRQAGDVPFYYIPPGEGREHLRKIYELLSVVHPDFSTFPYDKMLGYMSQHLHPLPCLIHAGSIPKGGMIRFAAFEKKGIRLLDLKVMDEWAELHPFSTFGKEGGNGR